MQILKEPNKWWIEQILICPCCEASFKLNSTTKVYCGTNKIDGLISCLVPCPICDYGLTSPKN